MLWTWGAPVLTGNGRVKGGVSSPRSCLWNVHSKKWRDLLKLQWQYKYLAFEGKCVQPSDACLIVYPDFFFVVDSNYLLTLELATDARVHVSMFFFFSCSFVNGLVFLLGCMASCFCFCHTRSQLYYQHGTSAWHLMSWWYNEIKEVSHTCTHCVLDVWKCLLCKFCNLGEEHFQRCPWRWTSPTGDRQPWLSFEGAPVVDLIVEHALGFPWILLKSPWGHWTKTQIVMRVHC